MITVNIRRQGGAAVMTIPSDVLRMLNVEVGATLVLEIIDGSIVVRPIQKTAHKRYSLAELLRGVTKKSMDKLNAQTAWAQDGDPVGREIV